jgi:hypothetical protein
VTSRRTPSGLAFETIGETAERARMRAAANLPRDRTLPALGVVLSPEAIDHLARFVQAECYEAIAYSHHRTMLGVRRAVLEEFGLPPEPDAGHDDVTPVVIRCTQCGGVARRAARSHDHG